MSSEISVERQFRFHCSCGATIVTGDKTVTCTACGITLGVRRVRRHRQHSGSVAYYGSRTLPVRRVERHRQEPNAFPPVEAHAVLHQIREERTLTSFESDFEDQPGDGAHGGFIVFLLVPMITLIILLYRSCASE